MGVRIPRANTGFNLLTNANLKTQGQNVVNGLTAAIADYPTPPILPADLQALVNTFSTDLSASVGGTKTQRKTMEASRLALRNALRSDASYVNTIAWNQVQAGDSYSDVSTSITTTGYTLGTNPSPAGPLDGPSVRKYGSSKPGQFDLLLNKVVGAKGYQVNLVDDVLGTTTTYTYSNTRIEITGLISARRYVAKLASIGSNPARNFTSQVTQVIT